MKWQREPTTCFGPRQPSQKKQLGQRMMQICKEVQHRKALMPLNVPYIDNSPNRGDYVGNIGCARVAVKSRKKRDNFAFRNGNIVPLGKSRKFAVSPSSMGFGKSSCSNFSSEGLGKLSLQVLKDISSDRNRISSKPPHSRKVSVETPLTPNKVKVVASTQGKTVGHIVRSVVEHNEELSLKNNAHKNPSSKSKRGNGTEDHRRNSDVNRKIETSSNGNNIKRNIGLPVKDCRTDSEKLKSKSKGLSEKRSREHANGIERRCYEGEDGMNDSRRNFIGRDDHNIAGADVVIDGLITQTAIVEQYGSLPIDEPIWSGILKTESEGYVSLEAHLLAKSCEKVWECSRSLRPMVQVTKFSRVEAEPICFRVSSPTEDNIGLYFFPQGMRPNEEYDKLVKEVTDNDLILRAIVDEVEMLIFPSVLLPERHKTFQGKQYLWGLFKRREDNVDAEGEEQLNGTCLSGHENDKGKQQRCSLPRVGKECIDKERTIASLARAEASARPAQRAAATPALAATAAPSHAPGGRAAAEAAVTPHASSTRPAEGPAAEAAAPASAVTSHAPSPTPPAARTAAEAATPAPAAAAAGTPASPSSAVPHEATYGFIGHGQSTAKIQQLLQELVREGAVVFAMRGEMIGFGSGRQ